MGHTQSLSFPGLERALGAALAAARSLEDTEGAPEHEWLKKTALAIRVWVSIMRSCANFYFAQVIRDRNREAISGPSRVPPKAASWTGHPDIIAWNSIMRSELDNAAELVAVLERGGLDVLSRADDPKYEDTFTLGPDILGALSSKLRIMREHWLDVEDYLAPPLK